MTEASRLRAEAQRLRTLALDIADSKVLGEVWAMVEELERRARFLDNGDADDTLPSAWPHATRYSWISDLRH